MRLEKRKQQEMREREGLARRTVIQTVWLLLSGIITYFIVQALFDAQILTYSFFYSTLGLPSTFVDDWMIQAALILIGIIVMQFFFILGYVIASPEGRRPTGKASTRAQDPDPLEDMYQR